MTLTRIKLLTSAMQQRHAHIESYHKTMKYTVGYPKMFTSIDLTRSWYADFVHWYNTAHLHSALGNVTPHQRRSGEADKIYATRNRNIAEAREKEKSIAPAA